MTKASPPAGSSIAPTAPASPSDAELTSSSTEDLTDVRLVYQAAITAFTYEGAQIWARFNAMLVAHGMLIAVISQLLVAGRAALFTAALALMGLVVSLLGLSITVRGFAYHDTYLVIAKDHEAQLSAAFLQLDRSKEVGPARLDRAASDANKRLLRYCRLCAALSWPAALPPAQLACHHLATSSIQWRRAQPVYQPIDRRHFPRHARTTTNAPEAAQQRDTRDQHSAAPRHLSNTS
jgi:hypothetical protein